MKETKSVKMAFAFGMARTKLGYYTKEELVFSLSDDESKNEEKVSEFAKKHECRIVEVWYREDTAWDKVKFHKLYNFLPEQITGNELDGISKYR